MAASDASSIVPFGAPPSIIELRMEEGLILYKAVLQADVPEFKRNGILPLKRTGPDAGRIGLRESPEAALERASLYHDRVGKDTHCLLQVRFTPLGVGHFAVLCQGQEHAFCPTLFKKTYRDDTDWGVWHFLEDLPLNAYSSDGRLMIESQWLIW